jgi:hypothetical protein
MPTLTDEFVNKAESKKIGSSGEWGTGLIDALPGDIISSRKKAHTPELFETTSFTLMLDF